jgi:DDE superfamily endonuclease/Tc5 transposase DNA-binding domain
MTRPKNKADGVNEARLQKAIAEVLDGKHTCYSAHIAFDVPCSTLYDRVKYGKKARNQAHEDAQNLTHAEEAELVRWITRLTICGYAPRYETLQRLAEIIKEGRVKTDEGEVPIKVHDKIGKEWVSRFLQRHSELASVHLRSTDTAWIKAVSPERLQHWFNDLEKVLVEFNIKPENIYNMDESGFAIGEKESGKVIINAHIRQKFQGKPGGQEWVTVVECVCVDGSVVPPLVIFKGEGLSRQWILTSIHGSWRFDCNSKGWISNKHGVDWLIRCFDPETRDKAAGQYRLLICDGHDSHITAEFIAHCTDNNILLMILPPHSSHLTQPLDVGVFGALKKQMGMEIEPLIRTGIKRVQKVEWLTAFVAAHDKAVSVKNILGGFRGTGIHPFLPTKVLRRVASTPPSESQDQPSTPANLLAPFNEAVCTDSPADFNVQWANVALNSLLDSNKALPTPAKRLSVILQGHTCAFMHGLPS